MAAEPNLKSAAVRNVQTDPGISAPASHSHTTLAQMDPVARWAVPAVGGPQTSAAQARLGADRPDVGPRVDRAHAGLVGFAPMEVLLTFIAGLLTVSLVSSLATYVVFRPAFGGALPSFPRWSSLSRGADAAVAPGANESARQCRLLLETATVLWREVEAAVLDLKSGLPLRTLLLEELSHISRRLARTPALQAAKAGALTTSESDQYWKLLARDIARSIRDMNRIKSVAEAGRASFGTLSNEPRMPTSLEEAYFVLGANRNVDIETLQRLVRALRQCWHPDLAQTEEDRVYREGRIRQINIANDIIRAHASAAATGA